MGRAHRGHGTRASGGRAGERAGLSLEPIIVSVEEAALDGSGELRVRGWAAGRTQVESVEIVVAGLRLGEAEYGLARPDVAAERPGLVEAAHSGFAFAARLEPAMLSATQAFVIVRAKDRPAQAAAHAITRDAAESASVPDDRLRFHCDNVALYDDGAVEIAGWAAHLHEVERIEVRLDGEPLGEAQFGRLRPDVGKSQSDIPSASRSGFEFGATLPGMAAGEHEVELAILTKAGDRFLRKLKASTQIARDPRHAAERQDIRVFVDSPEGRGGRLRRPRAPPARHRGLGRRPPRRRGDRGVSRRRAGQRRLARRAPARTSARPIPNGRIR